jgi:hypothetical protein
LDRVDDESDVLSTDWISKFPFLKSIQLSGLSAGKATLARLEYLMSELLELAGYCLRPERAGGGSMRVDIYSIPTHLTDNPSL